MSRDVLDQWIGRLFSHDRRAVAKLISWVEDDIDRVYTMRNILPRAGQSLVTGITGPPGAGKSSLVEVLTGEFRKQNERVGIVAVDPTSPYSGGAILGDRIRMQKHGTDRDVFIRSMGTRGYLGGVSRSTADVLKILEVGGYNRLLLETVGVGQSEIEIMKLADTVVVVLNPGTGDGIQAIKAGIMEIADIFVVNKSDLPGAERLKNDIHMMLEMNAEKDWTPPVLLTSVTGNKGISELRETIDSHHKYLIESGKRQERAQEIFQQEVWRHWEGKAIKAFTETWEKNKHICENKEIKDPYEFAEKIWMEIMGGGQIDE